MGATIKVSVIIPCYNSVKYLSQTIESVKKQDFKSWECIIVNDGSVDNTEELAKSLINGDPRFQYIYQENSGVCIARNRGAALAVGDYLLFLDADDILSENFLTETVSLLDTRQDVTVAASTVRFFGIGSGYSKVTSYTIPSLLAENQLVITSLVRKNNFHAVGGFNENMKEGLEDWDFWISILKNGGKIECADKAIFYYRLQNVSRNKLSIEKEKRLRYQIWQNHKELFSQHYLDITQTFEYKRYANTVEYRIGNLFIKPLRKTKAVVNGILNNFFKR